MILKYKWVEGLHFWEAALHAMERICPVLLEAKSCNSGSTDRRWSVLELEQEVASIIAFAQRVAGKINYYYWNLPEDFHFPALFFPQPEITTRGETYRTYASEYAWYIKVFAETTEQAHSIALSILTALKRAKKGNGSAYQVGRAGKTSEETALAAIPSTAKQV